MCVAFVISSIEFFFKQLHVRESVLIFFSKHFYGFVGPLIPLFWTSDDVCPGFQTKVDPLNYVFHRLCAMDSPDSPLVLIFNQCDLVRMPQRKLESIYLNVSRPKRVDQ